MNPVDIYSYYGVEFGKPWVLIGQSKERFLNHHGIQGQKWGVKNGPPYPLDSKIHNDIVKQKRVEDVKNRLDARKSGFDSLESIPKAKNDYKDEVFNKHNEKEFLKGLNKLSEIREEIKNNNLTEEEAEQKYYDRAHNCYFCTQAGLMRLKGYEVRAQEANKGLPGNISRKLLWENSSVIKKRENGNVVPFNDWHEVMSAFASRGNGSYGEFGFQWKLGSGHSVMWAVNKNEVVFMDGQFEKVRGIYKINSGEFTPELDKMLGKIDLSKISLFNMTNATPTDYMLKMIE